MSRISNLRSKIYDYLLHELHLNINFNKRKNVFTFQNEEIKLEFSVVQKGRKVRTLTTVSSFQKQISPLSETETSLDYSDRYIIALISGWIKSNIYYHMLNKPLSKIKGDNCRRYSEVNQ